MPLKKVKLEPVGELEIPVDEPNENNTVDLESKNVAVAWIVVHLQKSKTVKFIKSGCAKAGCVGLLISLKRKALSGEDLNNIIINFVQKLLKK